jgi:hypothetical protein
VVVFVVVVASGAGIVVVDCSDDDVVRVVGAEPQPASIAVPAINATPNARLKPENFLVISPYPSD